LSIHVKVPLEEYGAVELQEEVPPSDEGVHVVIQFAAHVT